MKIPVALSVRYAQNRWRWVDDSLRCDSACSSAGTIVGAPARETGPAKLPPDPQFSQTGAAMVPGIFRGGAR